MAWRTSAAVTSFAKWREVMFWELRDSMWKMGTKIRGQRHRRILSSRLGQGKKWKESKTDSDGLDTKWMCGGQTQSQLGRSVLSHLVFATWWVKGGGGSASVNRDLAFIFLDVQPNISRACNAEQLNFTNSWVYMFYSVR